MILDGRFLAFVGVAVILIVTPGPDTAMVTRNAFRGGVRGASRTALGVSLGLLTWGAASAAGLAAVLAASAVAFTVLKTAGAAVLAVMGLRSLVAAVKAGRPAPADGAQVLGTSGAPAFVQGLLGNLLNPKAGAIFLTVVPQFVRPGDPAARIAAMVVLFAAMVCGWLHLYGWLVARARRRFGGRLRRALDGVTGAVLLGLGARLASEAR
ncbi:MAG TPA: LysE family translocator [Terriglobales bacterium]|nr:LysE family translocator [Terriglobales bacterium]